MDYLTTIPRPSLLNIFSDTLEPLGIIDRYATLNLRPSFFGLGSFEFTVLKTAQTLEMIKHNRVVEFNTNGLIAGIIEGIDGDLNPLSVQIRAYGPLLKGLTKRRVAVPSDDPELLGWDVAEGTAGHIMAHYVDRHMINPENPSRKIPLLRLTTGIESIGMLTVAKARFDHINDVLTSLAQYASVGWRIVIVDGAFEFQALPTVDRTENGDNPLILSTAFKNVGTASVSEDHTDYANTIYALGEGQYENRMRITVYDDDIIAEGWNRCETIADCGNEPSPTRLREVARQKVDELRKTGSMTLQLIAGTAGANLGDMVTVYLPEIGATYNLVLTEVGIRWQGAQKQVEVVLGKPPRTLTSELQRTRRLQNIT